MSERVLFDLARAYARDYPCDSPFRFILDDSRVITVRQEQWAEVTIRPSEPTLNDIWTHGSLALGDAYCDGRLTGSPAAIGLFVKFLMRVCQRPRLRRFVRFVSRLKVTAAIVRSNLLTISRTRQEDVNDHYSLERWLSNPALAIEFFQLWLGTDPVYSCADWEQDATCLEEAQQDKFRRYGVLLNVKPGDRLLDLGCGWGTLGFHFAEQGVHCTLVTLSAAQAWHIEREAARRGLTDYIELKVMDMLDVASLGQRFDAITSLGAIEHISDQDLPRLFQAAAMVLVPGGRAIWHTLFNTIGRPADAWLRTRMFPGARVPDRELVVDSLRAVFSTVDFTAFASGSYPRTFRIWADRFFAARPLIRKLFEQAGVTNIEKTVRAFEWYLICCSSDCPEAPMEVGFATCKV